MTFLLERDRVDARSRLGKAEEGFRVTGKAYDEAIAASDAAFDRWERRPNDDAAKREAMQLSERRQKACDRHIGAVTVFQQAKSVLRKLDDPQELERRVCVAEAHDRWWRSRR